MLYKKFHSINPHAVVLATPWSTLYEETESYYSEIMFDAELYISYIFDVGAFSYRDWKDYKELILSNLFNIVTFYDWHLRKIYYCVFVFFITWLQLLCIVWIFYSLVVRDVHCSPDITGLNSVSKSHHLNFEWIVHVVMKSLIIIPTGYRGIGSFFCSHRSRRWIFRWWIRI